MADLVKPFRFLDLPPELRNRVYLFALSPCGFIYYGSIYAPPHSTQEQLARGKKQPGDNPNFLFRANMPRGEVCLVHLLRTCRQINKEATPILYGENVFCVFSRVQAEIMIRTLGDRLEQLRKIKLRECTFHDLFKSTLVACKKIPNLDVLVIDRLTREGMQNVEKMALALRPLMRKLHKERKGTDRKQALDVLQFEWEKYGGDVEDDKKAAESYRREVREKLRGYLQ